MLATDASDRLSTRFRLPLPCPPSPGRRAHCTWASTKLYSMVPTPTMVFGSEVLYGYEYRMLELFPAQITFAGIWWDEGAFHGNRVEMETDCVVLECGCSLQEQVGMGVNCMSLAKLYWEGSWLLKILVSVMVYHAKFGRSVSNNFSLHRA